MTVGDEVRLTRELEDFEPSTGHVHGCPRRDCDCIHHLYAIAQDTDRARAEDAARLAEAWDEGYKAAGNDRVLLDVAAVAWLNAHVAHHLAQALADHGGTR